MQPRIELQRRASAGHDLGTPAHTCVHALAHACHRVPCRTAVCSCSRRSSLQHASAHPFTGRQICVVLRRQVEQLQAKVQLCLPSVLSLQGLLCGVQRRRCALEGLSLRTRRLLAAWASLAKPSRQRPTVRPGQDTWPAAAADRETRDIAHGHLALHILLHVPTHQNHPHWAPQGLPSSSQQPVCAPCICLGQAQPAPSAPHSRG